MKVGILTWHKAINHGAVLQTYATVKNLECLGCEVCVLDYDWKLYKNPDNTIINKIFRLLSNSFIDRIKGKNFFIRKRLLFNDFINRYLPIAGRYDEESGLGAVIIGSDMVFDLIQGYNPFMYGKNVICKYIFSYAASFGYTTKEMLDDFANKEEIVSLLSFFKSIGFRDSKTKEILDYLGINVQKEFTIDPVLCYGFNDEIDSWDSKKWSNRNYVLIYSYQDNMNDIETINCIRKIAKNDELELISLGYYHSWCHKCINVSPKEMLEVFKYAKYVVTDTFHGTVFSLLLHKRFVSFIRNNGFKVKDLLMRSGMMNCIVDDCKEIYKVLNGEYDYEAFEKWLMSERKQSLDFLKENIDNAGENVK